MSVGAIQAEVPQAATIRFSTLWENFEGRSLVVGFYRTRERPSTAQPISDAKVRNKHCRVT